MIVEVALEPGTVLSDVLMVPQVERTPIPGEPEWMIVAHKGPVVGWSATFLNERLHSGLFWNATVVAEGWKSWRSD